MLIFLPVIGFILYIFLGTGFRISKRKHYALKALADDVYNSDVTKRLNLGRSRVYLREHEQASRLLTYLKNQGDGDFTDNNAAEIYTDGREMFDQLLLDLRQATKHIHIFFYIFRCDRLGREILEILKSKATEGLEVRLMYDSVGTLMAFDTPFRELKQAGGQVEAFAPIFSNINSHLRLNYRNHRKIVVIDGVVGYVGGMNVGCEYIGEHKKLRPWRDTHMRITGSAVWFLQERFLMDWCYASETDMVEIDIPTYFPEPLELGTTPMQIISSGPDTFESPIKSGLLSMYYAARKNIYIQTPYLAPDESVLDALRIAARSNVDVRMMIPRISDYAIVHLATLGYARDLQALGVKIYMYNGFIHSKTSVIDGSVATIGTTNMTNRSFTLDFEVNAFVYDNDFAERCEAIFHNDEKTSFLLPENYFGKQNIFRRASYNFARMLAPMM
ncbi:MAG: cardiolipin synthase [Planctomycetaceae bacterium]|nr:cardiolipin synthase [Planctomycetaceae bacterium]